MPSRNSVTTYTVKEIFYTLQGEGRQAGRAAVFCRFAGCNLWSGREEDRAKAICQFCDTDFVGAGPDGGKFDGAAALAARIASEWPEDAGGVRYVVCTGGEPLLQLDSELIDALHAEGFEIAVETNGTVAAPPGIDWICVSPKAGAELKQLSGNELKLVYPQAAQLPDTVAHLDFDTFYLQPMDGPDLAAHTRAAIAYCMAHPKWRLSVQTHKMVNIR
ncbi:7-carboxy-7-deazaguanine synthase [Chromobacterium amazonense]|uniref:7-carboxy-7-deazaguanine synthase n=1 Tax=Chromobacterium amazonense TaxID=1382803 RepID=A0A1S1XBB1_9NEIS|nr:7-carboxy-7-deazaguanine synthase [Chromobacterium amazonense]MBM2884719.1 7-carboxy-7-deazaguanine synthase [Chromobacterium amazonense]OHX17262.1 7-carboxy-7-deazaguanine synthase [Chromobacterium amazonense]PRP70089.1 7-carboxy-7-deazaguanine synthase [Chromobacterium amazonense]